MRTNRSQQSRSGNSGASRSISTTPRRPPSAFTDNVDNGETSTLKDEKSTSRIQQKSKIEYESSSTSSDQEQEQQRLSIINSLIPESILKNNESSQKLNQSLSKTNSANTTMINATNRTVTFDQPVISAVVPPSPQMDDSSSKKSDTDIEVYKRNQELVKENRLLAEKIASLEKDIYVRRLNFTTTLNIKNFTHLGAAKHKET